MKIIQGNFHDFLRIVISSSGARNRKRTLSSCDLALIPTLARYSRPFDGMLASASLLLNKKEIIIAHRNQPTQISGQQSIHSDQYKATNAQREREREKESERKFYLTPPAPGCEHIAAGAAEVHL